MSMTRPRWRVDRRAEDRARGVERRDRAALVAAHQARVAGHVGHQDRGQALPRLGLAHEPLRSRTCSCDDIAYGRRPMVGCAQLRTGVTRVARLRSECAGRRRLGYNAGSRRHVFQSASTQSLPTPLPRLPSTGARTREQQADEFGRTPDVFRFPRPGRAAAACRSRSTATPRPPRSRRRPFPPSSRAATSWAAPRPAPARPPASSCRCCTA